MKAVGVIPSQKKAGILEHSVPEIDSPDRVKVRSLDVGICGTDREICTFVYGDPPTGSDYLVLGHESMGEVVEVGESVKQFKPGDLVVPSVRRPCTDPSCIPCNQGLQDFCTTGNFVERGIKESHGFMTEFYVEDERFLTFVPPELRDVAVLMEPLTIAEKGLKQAWAVQERLPWVRERNEDGSPSGRGLRAVVLGAGPIGILGAMKLQSEGFDTYVYSRSKAPNPKADIIEAIGARYISSLETSLDDLAGEIGGPIDLVYEAVGVSDVSFKALSVLGVNGIFIFTGIPAPGPDIAIDGDNLMRNIVLMNQAVVGTVNADGDSFDSAIKDLGIFLERWPDALNSIITRRYPIDSCRELLIDKATGIKNVISFE